MAKLLEQVKEIQRKAHVCPECGAMRAENPTHRILCANHECKDGIVPSPDIDALVGVIEVLEGAMKDCSDCGSIMCYSCDDCPVGMAQSILNCGLPDKEGT